MRRNCHRVKYTGSLDNGTKLWGLEIWEFILLSLLLVVESRFLGDFDSKIQMTIYGSSTVLLGFLLYIRRKVFSKGHVYFELRKFLGLRNNRVSVKRILDSLTKKNGVTDV